MDYGITIRTPAPFAEAVARVRDALKVQGFGVLTEIDVQATLRDKLGEDMEQYVILGPATRLWHTGRSPSTARSGCCSRATSWCGPSPARPSSRRSTRRPWSP
jgi:hypothetical protein